MGRALLSHLLTEDLNIIGVDPSELSREKCKDIETISSLILITKPQDCIFVCVPNPEDLFGIVDQIVNLPSYLQPNFFINFSTIGPNASSKIEEILLENCPKMVYIESPVTGGVIKAKNGQISFLCGCRDNSLMDPVLPLLKLMSLKIIMFNSVKDTSIAKLVNNIGAINNALGTLEALAFGASSGLELEKMFEFLEHGTAKSYVLSSTLRRPLLTGDFETGFALKLALKDMILVLEEAEELGIQMRYTSESVRQLQKALEEGMGNLVFPSVAFSTSLLDKLVIPSIIKKEI